MPGESHPVIRVQGASEHNLKGIDVDIPRGKVTAITGVSGSGKSSLAFDTIFAEGQRRYVESLSAHARQHLAQLQKPKVERIDGLSPTIAIQQRMTNPGPRSTVATATEIYDYLRLLFARCGTPHCWACGRVIEKQNISEIVDALLAFPERTRVILLAPLVTHQRGKHADLLQSTLRRGFVRVRVNGEVNMLEELEPLAPQQAHTIEAVVDRIAIKADVKQRLADSIETATGLANGRIIASVQQDDGTWSDMSFSTVLACPDHPTNMIASVSPQLFSFNNPAGACDMCHGLGTSTAFETDLVIPDQTVPLAEGAIDGLKQAVRKAGDYDEFVRDFCERFGVLPGVPFKNLKSAHAEALVHGDSKLDPPFVGVLEHLKNKWESTDSESVKQTLRAYQSEAPCPTCDGARLGPAARHFQIGSYSEGSASSTNQIGDILRMTVAEARDFFDGLTIEGSRAEVAEPILEGLRSRLGFLCEVGVDYITLNRAAQTLSGGEWQRLRLATQIGSSLAGVCYVLDEPTIGLHARDSKRLADILVRIAELDNTVIVVEHDDEVIRRADYMIDIGPEAGEGGGYVVAAGPLDEVLASEESVTAKYLTNRASIKIPDRRREPNWKFSLELKGVRENNLKNVDVRIPLGLFVSVTGVSGSGKSTLINRVLQRVLHRRIHRKGARPGEYDRIVNSNLVDRVVQVDQAPIGRSPRSTPASYTGILDLMRGILAKTREAKIRGYTPARFSFNVKGGRCEHCEGQGQRKVSMHFLPDVYITCDACDGQRFNRETLEVRYRGRNIAEMLEMRVAEAVNFFDNIATIKQRAAALRDVGLGYMRLGQSAATLSGGEAQRVKLAAELIKGSDGHTLYILDEPTTGLHFLDVRNLLTVLQRLVERGSSVIAIEHNLDVVKVSDWVIDLGPEGGHDGGHVVVEGSPESVAQCEESHTGQFLRGRLG
ncbi:MAG: excinuclease ABC subunit UvrA [Phycisphaerae bacterium]